MRQATGSSTRKSTELASSSQTLDKVAPQKQPNPYACPILGKCFHGNMPGHLSNECPNRSQVHLVELQEGKYEGVNEECLGNSKPVLVVLDGDEGDNVLCILEHFLLAKHCFN